MSDKRIQDLPPATVYLTGSELIPLVQDGVAKQVGINNVLQQPTQLLHVNSVEAASSETSAAILIEGNGYDIQIPSVDDPLGTTVTLSVAGNAGPNLGQLYCRGDVLLPHVNRLLIKDADGAPVACVSEVSGAGETRIQIGGADHIILSSDDVQTTGDFTVTDAFGCNGKAAQNVVTVNAASTDLASVVALCNQLRALLIANGQAQ